MRLNRHSPDGFRIRANLAPNDGFRQARGAVDVIGTPRATLQITGVGGHHQSAKLQPQVAVEIKANSAVIRTRR